MRQLAAFLFALWYFILFWNRKDCFMSTSIAYRVMITSSLCMKMICLSTEGGARDADERYLMHLEMPVGIKPL